jgi:AraC-like DNA-binding protein
MKAFYQNRTYNKEVPVSAALIKDLDFVAHWHTDIEVLYVCEGSIGAGINSEYRILQAGDISICGSNDIHYYDSEGMSSNVALIIFRPDILNAFKHWLSSLQPRSIFIGRDLQISEITGSDFSGQIRQIINSIISEMGQKKELYPQFTDLRIFELFLALFRQLPSYYADSVRNPDDFQTASDIKPMQKALTYLEENHAQEITLEQISSEVNLSRFYFSRLFRKTTGMNFNVYLNRIRADKAEELIRSTRKSIIEIAYETGFLSIRTFNRSFKAIKGFTPHSLRRAW